MLIEEAPEGGRGRRQAAILLAAEGRNGPGHRRVAAVRVDWPRARVVILVLLPNHNGPILAALDGAPIDTGAHRVSVWVKAVIVCLTGLAVLRGHVRVVRVVTHPR